MPKNLRQRRKGGNYWLDFTVRGRYIRETTGTADLEEAKAVLEERRAQVRRECIFGIEGEQRRYTWRETVARYADSKGHRPVVKCHCEICVSTRIWHPYLDGVTIDQIYDDAPMIHQFRRDQRALGNVGRTINQRILFVTRVLRAAALKWRWLERHPQFTYESEKDSRKRRPLTWDETDALIRHSPSHLARFVLLATNMGLRKRELCALKWDMLRTQDGVQYFDVPGSVMKMGESVRMPCNHVVRRVLAEGRASEYIVHFRGRRVHDLHSTAWRRARNAAGIPDVTIHELKHTFGHRLADAEVPEWVIKELLCHRSRSQSHHYARSSLRQLAEAVERLKRPGKVLSEVV